MDFLASHLQQIEQALTGIPFPAAPANLYEPCRYILSLGGKRIRPALTLMAHKLFDDNTATAVPAALTVELFHNFSLIHDDIMDKAPLRRGKPTVHTKWNETVGILSGDVMLVHTYKMLATHYTGGHLTQLLDIYNTTAIEVCEGQQMDMDFELRQDVTVAEYIHMISLKTSVLLGCALKMGAITANAGDTDANNLYAFGKNLGIAFQLRDDYLDAFGDPEQTGKQPGGDILAGKKTFLIIECAQHAPAEDAKQLFDLLAGNSDDKVAQVLALLRKYKVEDLVQREIEKYQAEALAHLHKVNVSDVARKPFVQLADFLMNRQS